MIRDTRHPSRIVAVFTCLLAVWGAGSTGAADDSAQFPLTVDNCGEDVTIPQRPERVLTIGVTALNLVVASGGADRIVARAGEAGVVPAALAGSAAEDAPIITPEDPSTEAIIGSGADIVIGYGLVESNPQDLRAAGISSIFVSGLCSHAGTTGGGEVDFDDVYDDLELYGRLFGTQDTAAQVVADLKERVAAVEAGDSAPRSAAAIYFTEPTSFVFGNRSMMHHQMQAAGLDNVFSDVNEQATELSTETLIALDPDVIILVYGYHQGQTFEKAMAGLLALPGAADLTAVRDDQVVGLFGYETEPDQTAVDGLAALADELSRLG